MARLRTVLLLSLLANVFAFGLIGGGLVAFWHPGTAAAGRAQAGRALVDAGAALPPHDHARFTQVMQDTLAANRSLRREARRDRLEAASLFTAPVFDRAAVAAALDGARTADSVLHKRLEAAALDFAATLPADERALLAEALEHGGPLRARRP